ncbi:MAG: tyrosine-type recombinase/integrase [Anaerolineales bacterium]|nr:tyrosine-type recombinase/integrase [Anaerolineales bacterium]
MLLSEAINYFVSSQRGMLSDKTLHFYSHRMTTVCDFLEDPDLENITVQDLNRWRAAMFAKGWAPATVAGGVRAIRRFYAWLEEHELITAEQNIGGRVKKPPVRLDKPKAATVDDIQKVLEYLGELAQESHIRGMAATGDIAIIPFFADTGCRVGELIGITLGDLNLKKRYAVVTEKGRGGGKRRRVFFSQPTAEALSHWLAIHPGPIRKPGTPLFVSLGLSTFSEPLGYNGIRLMLDRRAAAANVTGRFNAHSFRHCAAREWLKNGADLATVSQLLGHSSITVTAQHYAIFANNELGRLHERVSYVNGLAGGAS